MNKEKVTEVVNIKRVCVVTCEVLLEIFNAKVLLPRM